MCIMIIETRASPTMSSDSIERFALFYNSIISFIPETTTLLMMGWISLVNNTESLVSIILAITYYNSLYFFKRNVVEEEWTPSKFLLRL